MEEDKERKPEPGSEKSKGIYTPEKTPEDVGQKSGGEYNWEHSSDKPIEK